MSIPTIRIAKNSLNGGDVSPSMNARFDQQRYQNGCHKLLNMVPLPTGGITKRPGWESLAGSHFVDGEEGGDPDTATRLIPFVFSANESRVLEFVSSGDGGCAMRVWNPDGFAVGPLIHLPWLDRYNLNELTYCQSADVLFLAHTSFPPLKLCRYSDTDWRLEVIEWLPKIQPPEAPAQIGWEGNPGEWSWDIQLATYKYVITAIEGQTGEESLAGPEAKIENVVPVGTNGYYITLTVTTPVEGASEYRVYKKYGGVYGYIGRIPAENDPLLFEDKNIMPDVEDTPPNGRNPFEGEGNYPAVVFLHQQRLGFASSLNKPMTVWMSQVGNYESMSASYPPKDDDAIEASLAANQANRIIWCESDRSGLAIGTEGGEWTLTNGDEGAVTPSQISFNPHTYHGSELGLPVLRAGASLIFTQRGGFCVREFGYSFESDRYVAPEISVLARHVLDNGKAVISWTWQPEPYGIIWFALRHSGFASCTYLREHEVIAWARHETNGQVESLTSIPYSNGYWQVWGVVRREVVQNGRVRICRFVERLRPFYANSQSENFPAGAHLDGPDDEIFRARCIPCMPDSTIQDGTSFLRVRKINAIKLRVENCAPFRAQVTGKDISPSPVRNVPERPCDFTHEPEDWACPVAAGFRDDPYLELIFDGAAPATVLGQTASVEFATQALGQK